MEHIRTFKNERLTFDWLDAYLKDSRKGWYIEDETADTVSVAFRSHSDAEYATQCLPPVTN